MSVAKSIGSSIGASAAYAKHSALSVASGSGVFVADVFVGMAQGYAAKDAELAERRAIAAAERRSVALPVPNVQRQKKVAVA